MPHGTHRDDPYDPIRQVVGVCAPSACSMMRVVLGVALVQSLMLAGRRRGLSPNLAEGVLARGVPPDSDVPFLFCGASRHVARRESSGCIQRRLPRRAAMTADRISSIASSWVTSSWLRAATLVTPCSSASATLLRNLRSLTIGRRYAIQASRSV